MTAVIHPERAAAHARGDLAERAVDVAAQLAFLVRDEGSDAIGAFLDGQGIPADTETRTLLVVLAAMVSIDATPDQMLSWVTWDEFGAPLADGPEAPAGSYRDCGTATAYWRHKRAGHPQEQIETCGCGQAGRDYYAARYSGRKGGQVKAVAPKAQTEARIGDYARLRAQGDSIDDAAARLGISRRTAERYEAKLKEREETTCAALPARSSAGFAEAGRARCPRAGRPGRLAGPAGMAGWQRLSVAPARRGVGEPVTRDPGHVHGHGRRGRGNGTAPAHPRRGGGMVARVAGGRR